jgi:hypothetical protein
MRDVLLSFFGEKAFANPGICQMRAEILRVNGSGENENWNLRMRSF